jgi:hypothetical protein
MWLRLPSLQIEHAKKVLGSGFKIHHAREDYVLFYRGLGQEGAENLTLAQLRLPSYTSHSVGCGGIVLNEKDELLLVQEKHGPRRGFWNVP